MSRIGKAPINLPKGVEVKQAGSLVTINGSKGTLDLNLHASVEIKIEDNVISVAPRDGGKSSVAMSGTTRALLNNMVVGVSQGFEKKLQLVGVGYRAKAQGNTLSLSLGFSHPVDYVVPAGITVETPTQTEVVIRGVDKQQVGQVAAEIREYRAPEPYKGKGVRYSDENVRRKEAKKK